MERLFNGHSSNDQSSAEPIAFDWRKAAQPYVTPTTSSFENRVYRQPCRCSRTPRCAQLQTYRCIAANRRDGFKNAKSTVPMTCPVNLGSLPIWCAAAKDGHPLKNPLCHPLCPSLHCDARNFIQTLASDCSVSARSRPISGSSSTTRNQARAGGGTGAVGASTSLNSTSKLERECWLASVRQHQNLRRADERCLSKIAHFTIAHCPRFYRGL
jgi:hypothetical protein